MTTKQFYHVSFSYQENKVKGVLFGRVCLPLPFPPTHSEHLAELEQSIAVKYKVKRPVIQGWQLMREEQDNENANPGEVNDNV